MTTTTATKALMILAEAVSRRAEVLDASAPLRDRVYEALVDELIVRQYRGKIVGDALIQLAPPPSPAILRGVRPGQPSTAEESASIPAQESTSVVQGMSISGARR